MNKPVEPSKNLGYSDIYLDFLSRKEEMKQFYPATSLQDVVGKLDSISFPREDIANILKIQNERFGASRKTLANIELLKDPKTVCVFSGQQAGLFGGPLLVVIKALAVVKAAELYAKELRRPVIPIFWIAGDDHDFEEVNHTFVQDRDSQIVKISYDPVPEIELPTSELQFSDKDELEKTKALLKETLGDTDFTSGLYDLIDEVYTSTDTYVTAFGKLMAFLTKEFGLVFFSPGDSKAKRLAVELFTSIIEKQDTVHALLDETNEKIQHDGYHIQVEKKADSTHLFYNINGRTAVLKENGKFVVGETIFSKEELIEKIKSEPEKFSPDVITRPILQSYLFPVLSQKGGAAEIAYLAQINKLFDLFNLVTPYYKARPTLTIVEKRFETLMAEHDIKFEELVDDVELLINRILAESFPENIEEKFKSLRNHIKCHFEDFSEESLKFDPTLENFAKQTMGKIDFNLNNFESKVFSSHKKRSKRSRERIYRLWHSLYPNRSFQERVINISFFISRYGFDFVKFLYENIDSEDSRHQLIYLSEFVD